MVINTQSYKQLAKTARLQATHLGVWAVQQTQWDEIRSELAGRQGMSKEDLEVAWQTATRQPHGFLWLAYNAPVGSKMWSGFTKNGIEMKSLAEIIGQAVVNKKLTKAQASSLLRHRKHHTEGHMLLMMKLMIEKHMTFSDAHRAAMKQVGK